MEITVTFTYPDLSLHLISDESHKLTVMSKLGLKKKYRNVPREFGEFSNVFTILYFKLYPFNSEITNKKYSGREGIKLGTGWEGEF